MRQGLADGPAGGGVPQPRRLVPAPGEDRLAVGAERHGMDIAECTSGLAEGPAGGGVPQPRRLVSSAVRIVLPSGLNATAVIEP